MNVWHESCVICVWATVDVIATEDDGKAWSKERREDESQVKPLIISKPSVTPCNNPNTFFKCSVMLLIITFILLVWMHVRQLNYVCRRVLNSKQAQSPQRVHVLCTVWEFHGFSNQRGIIQKQKQKENKYCGFYILKQVQHRSTASEYNDCILKTFQCVLGLSYYHSAVSQHCWTNFPFLFQRHQTCCL